ncbi:hypothetical protein ACT8ZV_07015 [Nocardioides sp. MAHUQ-72]|uniref:hypothetical protein n=1 Tax=unclassified Nocardioides TaxID=2615069 RepID=UPI0036116683
MRLTTIGAFGVAFVLGARAGRERYDQIQALAQQAARRLESYGEGGSLASGWRAQHGDPSRRE